MHMKKENLYILQYYNNTMILKIYKEQFFLHCYRIYDKIKSCQKLANVE